MEIKQWAKLLPKLLDIYMEKFYARLCRTVSITMQLVTKKDSKKKRFNVLFTLFAFIIHKTTFTTSEISSRNVEIFH